MESPEQYLETEQQFIDPQAPAHQRIIEQKIDGAAFVFRWTRMAVADLLYILVGVGENPNESAIKGMNRMLLKTVGVDQKGLLMDMLGDKANYTLGKQLIESQLPIISENETHIGWPECTTQGDLKKFTVPLTTDGKTEIFRFQTDRNKFDEFETAREDVASDQTQDIHNYLSACLEHDDKQRQRFNNLAFDERNFTLSAKIYGKVRRFLALNQVTIETPTKTQSVK